MANELYLYGTVGASWWDEEHFTAAQVRQQLAGMTGPITVRINSGGGIATEGQAIYTMLSDYPGEVAVIVDGVAASAASLIAMAGDTITMRLGAWMLIHDPAQPYTEGRGTEDEHLRLADKLRIVSGAYADVYARRAGMTRDEARAVMRAETIYDGPAAVAAGFATAYDEATPAAAAAHFDYRMYAHAPKELREACEGLSQQRLAVAARAIIGGEARATMEKPTMPEDILPEDTAKDTPAVAPATDAPPAPVVAADITIAERTRARRILDAVTVARLPSEFATDMIAADISVEVALDRITAKWKEQGDMDQPTIGRPTATITRDERDTMRVAMGSAIVAQMGRAKPDTDAARPYMAMSLVEMAATAIGHRGPIRTAYDRDNLMRMAFHTTSDFPSVLENALNKRMQSAYDMAKPVYQQIAARMDFTDFRPHPISNIGSMPELQPVNATGEIKFGTVGDKKEVMIAQPRGIILALDRQMILNDDLGAIDRVVATSGQAVARTEETVFFAMLLSGSGNNGPTMLETTRQLFNTTDGTLAATAAAITVPSVALGRAAIQKHKGIGGEDLGLTPSILLVGPDKLTEAEQLVAAIQPQAQTNVNPFSGRLTVISTPKITGNAWYLMTAPSVASALAYGFLSGDEGPRIRMDEPFGVQGVRYSIERDFGCGAIDRRGVYRNAGA